MEAVKAFQFVSIGDLQGVMYWLGTGKGQREWSNPADSGDVAVHMSSKMTGSPGMFVDHTFDEQVLTTTNQRHSWIGVDLKSCVCSPTVYTFAHRAVLKDFYIRSWWLEGSHDGFNWVVLDERGDDETITHNNLWAAYALNETDKFYRYFRIRMKQAGNSRKNDVLNLSCFEVYGNVRQLTQAQMAAGSGGRGRGRGGPLGGGAPAGAGRGVGLPAGPQGVRATPY
eukprot:TRINITY_DN6465_c0_g1_i1.p2 TRINITY_DN6465_c0_g1~~TRINITY_DN6465_c0_g1_i1.p2  ORF type:complete len:226 (+),score=31.87 TRINITY_DN6465_c0_g1_i1:88-765(+)